MQLEFGYGNGVQTVELPQENLLGVLHAAPSSMNAGDRMRSRGRWRTRSAQHRSMRWPDPARRSRSSPAISRVPCPLIRSSRAFPRRWPSRPTTGSWSRRWPAPAVWTETPSARIWRKSPRSAAVDFTVNVVLDEHKQIVYAVAGDVTLAHRAGCAYLDRMYRCPIPEKADIVLVSQGGAPKDANLYQTQKALDNAKHAVKDGGTIILIGACPEGLGSKTLHCRICRTQAPITAGHNKLKSSRSQMRPAAFSDNMQVQAQTLRPM